VALFHAGQISHHWSPKQSLIALSEMPNIASTACDVFLGTLLNEHVASTQVGG